MAAVKECLILAAGNGSRIASLSGSAPKPLVPLFGAPLLEHIVLSSQAAGIEKFVIVVGYRADAIRRWFAERPLGDTSVTLVENAEYHKANGVSALAARGLLKNPFLLLMADHIFEPKTAKVLLQKTLGDDEVILGVDYNSIASLTWKMQLRLRSKERTYLISEKTLASTTPWILGCFCAEGHCSSGWNPPNKTAIAHCRMACAGCARSAN